MAAQSRQAFDGELREWVRYFYALKDILRLRILVTLAGSGERGFEDGPPDQAQFNGPFRLTVDGDGNVYVVDGLITDLPFPDGFADLTIEGHVFGDYPEEEHSEMVRVTRRGGMVVHCPGNVDRDNEWHRFLVSRGYEWSRFEEPGEGMVRKYWKTV